MTGKLLRKLTRLFSGAGARYQGTDADCIDLGYRAILKRPPDPQGRRHFLGRLQRGELDREEFLKELIKSGEFHSVLFDTLIDSVHFSRLLWIKSLPRAERILDLGGTALGNPDGALVVMGYPYRFKELTIVDLPVADRHPLYAKDSRKIESHLSPLGEVRYVYSSMTELDSFADGSMDLIHCGQAIEHVHEKEADTVFGECRRILKPDGGFVLDTPNGRATRLQSDAFIDPDHKVEYRHEELKGKLVRAGFAVVQSRGMNHLPESFARGRFDPEEVKRNFGVYDDPENCYLLAYVCRKNDGGLKSGN